MSVLTRVGDEERSHKASNQIGHTAVPITVDQHMQAHNQGEAGVPRLGGEQSPPCFKMEMKLLHTHSY